MEVSAIEPSIGIAEEQMEDNFDESSGVTLGSSSANFSTVAFDTVKPSTSAAAQSAEIINVSEAIKKFSHLYKGGQIRSNFAAQQLHASLLHNLRNV